MSTVGTCTCVHTVTALTAHAVTCETCGGITYRTAAQPSQVSAEQLARQIFFHVLLNGGEGNPFKSIRNEWFVELAVPKIVEVLSEAVLAAIHPQPQKCERSLTIRYTNYRGETSDRSIEPGRIYFGSTEWHPEEQWLLEAFDFDRKAGRTFALKDIQWKTKAYASSREQK